MAAPHTRRPWAPAEDAYLRSCVGKLTYEALATALQRTRDSIDRRIQILGLRWAGRQELPTPEQQTILARMVAEGASDSTIARRLGVSRKRARAWRRRLASATSRSGTGILSEASPEPRAPGA